MTDRLRFLVGLVLVGAIAIWIPEVAGNGYEPLNALLNQWELTLEGRQLTK